MKKKLKREKKINATIGMRSEKYFSLKQYMAARIIMCMIRWGGRSEKAY